MKILQQLTHNAVVEGRFTDAANGYYHVAEELVKVSQRAANGMQGAFCFAKLGLAMYVCVCSSVYGHICLMYVCMHMYMHVCMYVCVHV